VFVAQARSRGNDVGGVSGRWEGGEAGINLSLLAGRKPTYLCPRLSDSFLHRVEDI